ncbi:OPT oligopeptide transporter protein-domain-containing protein [Dipodascopsis uninucleata]
MDEIDANLPSKKDQTYVYTDEILNNDENEALRTITDVELVLDKINVMSSEEAIRILKDAIVEHDSDINFSSETMDRIKLLVLGPEHYKKPPDEYEFDLRAEAALIAYYSPYPEVRSVTDPFDDVNMTCESIRVYVLAIIWTIIGTGVSQFFAFRKPSITITSAVIQLFLYPCGKAWELVVPRWKFKLFGQEVSLNPGPWTLKEQMLATLMVNVANGGTYVTKENIMTQKLSIYYNTDVALGYEFLMNFSSQFFGFGFAGMLRRWVVYPVKAIWPTVLPTLALNRALLAKEKKTNINGWTISRYPFFLIVFVGSFLYFWLPDYLFQALSTFNWMTWIAPKNFTLAIITGSSLGLGFNPITSFDWNIINYSYCMTIPFYSYVQRHIGMTLGGMVVIALYWTNYKWCAYLPINTNDLRDHFNKSYNVTRVLTNHVLDEEKYQAYSPPYYSAGFMVTYGTYFVMYPFSMIYILLREWRPIRDSFIGFTQALRRKSKGQVYDHYHDAHSVMMRSYKEVPDWWYLVLMLLSFVFGVIAVETYKSNTETPVYGIVVTILASVSFLVPFTIVRASTGYSLSISVLAEMIAGFMFPGNGTANLILKCYGAEADSQAESFASDQKMSHYAKIPPRAMYRGQLVTTFFQCIVSIGVVQWQMYNIHDLCAADQPDRFTCPGLKTIYSASVMWGVIGPMRTFQGIYTVFAWCFLAGAIMGPLFYLLWLKVPRTRKMQPLLVMAGFMSWAPYNLAYYTPGLYASSFFMYYIRRRYLAWWEKYNYVLSAALTAGVAFSAIIIFFSVQYEGKTVSWWGNTVISAGVDGGKGRQTRLELPEKGYFGLDPGTYP